MAQIDVAVTLFQSVDTQLKLAKHVTTDVSSLCPEACHAVICIEWVVTCKLHVVNAERWPSNNISSKPNVLDSGRS